MDVINYYHEYSFKENITGRFDERILNSTLIGVDKYLNICHIINGNVKRDYLRDGSVPSYAREWASGYKIGNFHLERSLYDSKDMMEIRVYSVGKDVECSVLNGKQIGIINKYGRYEGAAFTLADRLTDQYDNDMVISRDGKVIGHEGPIYTKEGYRLYINKFNQVDLVQTKLYLLFDYLASKISKMALEYLELEVDHSEDNYPLVKDFYVKGNDGLKFAYFSNQHLGTNTVRITIDDDIIAELETHLSKDSSYIHGFMFIDGKYEDVSNINRIDALNRTINTLLSSIKYLVVDEYEVFNSKNNDFKGSNSLEDIHQQRSSNM